MRLPSIMSSTHFDASVNSALAVHHRLADQPLIGAAAIERGSVEEGDAQVECAVEQPHALVLSQAASP